jgi:hypothetical protein
MVHPDFVVLVKASGPFVSFYAPFVILLNCRYFSCFFLIRRCLQVKNPQDVLPPALGASIYAMACILSYDGLPAVAPSNDLSSNQVSNQNTKEADSPREMEWVISHLMVSSCLCLQMSRTMQLNVLLAVEDKAISKDSVVTSDHGLKGSHVIHMLGVPFHVSDQGTIGLERNKIV